MVAPKKTVKRQRDPVAKVKFKRRSKDAVRAKKSEVGGVRCTFTDGK